MKEIPLTRGYVALVDDEDFAKLQGCAWQAGVVPGRKAVYANGRVPNSGKRGKHVIMHRVIMDAPPGVDVDHIDGNGLNNQRSNLRLCSRKDNLRNRGALSRNTSGYKGVTWSKKKKKWYAQIRVDGKNKSLGFHDDIQAAALAYQDAAKEHHGDFARW